MQLVHAAGLCTAVRIQEALLVTQQSAANQKAGNHAQLKQGSVRPKQGQACNWWDGKLAISMVITVLTNTSLMRIS